MKNTSATTNHIVETATRLFTHRGVRAVSMDDIAGESGISKKTLYRNFESKEMMVRTIVQKLISNTSTYIRLCPEISPNAVKELENFSEHIRSVLEILTPEFIRDLKKYYPGVYHPLIVFRDHSLIPYLESCLNRGITEEIFRSDIDTRNTGWLYCWQIQNALEGDITTAVANSIIESTNDLFLHGIFNSKGLKLFGMNRQNEYTGQKERPVMG